MHGTKHPSFGQKLRGQDNLNSTKHMMKANYHSHGDVIYMKLQSGVLENKTQVLRDLSRSSPHVNLWRENEEVGGE